MKNAMSYSAAVKLIEKGSTPLCLFLYGPEDYLKEDLTRRAEARFIAPGMKSFNYSTFDLAETTVGEALAAAEAFPALGGARMVVVRNAQRLSRSKVDRELVNARLAAPPEALVLFFVAGDLDAKTPILGSLPAELKPVMLKGLGERDMDTWLTSRAEAIGLKLSPAAKSLLLELTGRSMWQASNELEKLSVNAAGREEVSEEDVLALVPGSSRRSPFALADAIRGADRSGAAELTSELLELGEAPVALTALIAGQTLRGWAACSGGLSAGSPLAKEFRRRALLLCETDSALKRSKVEPFLATQLMVDALTRRRG